MHMLTELSSVSPVDPENSLFTDSRLTGLDGMDSPLLVGCFTGFGLLIMVRRLGLLWDMRLLATPACEVWNELIALELDKPL